MIDKKEVEKLIEERKKIHPDDPSIIDKWCELTKIFVKNEEDTLIYLNNCSKEEITWISEIFEDISEQLQSWGFIKCIEQLANKYSDLDLEQDIFYAKKQMR